MVKHKHKRRPDAQINFRGRALVILATALSVSLILFSGLAALDVLRTGEMSDNTAGFLLPIFTGLIGGLMGYITGRTDTAVRSSEEGDDMKITEQRPDGTIITIDTDTLGDRPAWSKPEIEPVPVEDLLPEYRPGDIIEQPEDVPVPAEDDDPEAADVVDEDETDYDADEDGGDRG